MIDTLTFVITTAGIGIFSAIPAIILGYWLEKTNAAPNRAWFSLIFCIALVFIWRMWFADLSNYWLLAILLIGSTLGVYRMDVYWAIVKSEPE